MEGSLHLSAAEIRAAIDVQDVVGDRRRVSEVHDRDIRLTATRLTGQDQQVGHHLLVAAEAGTKLDRSK
jgi:hypothetical protein